MESRRYRICATLTDNDLAAAHKVAPLVDLYEVRIDLIGRDWPTVAGKLKKPWIACNRRVGEGGRWEGSEEARIGELYLALEAGARVVDIELGTRGLDNIIGKIKDRAECLVSYHDLAGTPPLPRLREIVRQEKAVGADICKVVTTARSFKDNLKVLQLLADSIDNNNKMVCFAMGEMGRISRVLCPLIGGYFTYASVREGREAAGGQVAARELRGIYRLLEGR